MLILLCTFIRFSGSITSKVGRTDRRLTMYTNRLILMWKCANEIISCCQSKKHIRCFLKIWGNRCDNKTIKLGEQNSLNERRLHWFGYDDVETTEYCTTASSILGGSVFQEGTRLATDKLERCSQEWDSPGKKRRQQSSTEKNGVGVWSSVSTWTVDARWM